MKIKVLYFGPIHDLTQKIEEWIELEDEATDATVVLEYIIKKYPSISNRSFQLACGKKLVKNTHKIYDGDEVALLPPFAGG